MYDPRKVVLQKKRFLLDEQERPIQGVVFDGKNDLVARVDFGFDDLGRLVEERTFDARGRIVRRIIFRYNALGVRSPPLAFNFNTNNPEKPVRIAPEAVRPAIANPEFNGNNRVTGDRYFNGEVEADQINLAPKLPERVRPLRR